MAGAEGRSSIDARVDLVVCGLCDVKAVERSCSNFDFDFDFGLGFGLGLVTAIVSFIGVLDRTSQERVQWVWQSILSEAAAEGALFGEQSCNDVILIFDFYLKMSCLPVTIRPDDAEAARAAKLEILSCLKAIDPFPARADGRNNVRMPGQKTPYKHFILGKVKALNRPTLSPSQFNVRYPELLKACRALMRAWEPGFRYDCIQVNKSQQMPPHKDSNNRGTSRTIALGKFTGGELGVRTEGEGDKEYKVRNKLLKFDGAKSLHWVKAFKGERYSLVFFKLRWKS
jgi:hypothetical protein